jgi:glutamyl-tRNA synthetase
MPIIKERKLDACKEYVSDVAGLMKERATFIQDILADGDYFFSDITEYDAKTVRKKWKDDTADLMRELTTVLEGVEEFTTENIETAFSGYLNDNEYGFGKIGPGFRLLVTGKGMGPSMFEICSVLGKDYVIPRMKDGIDKVIALKAQ